MTKPRLIRVYHEDIPEEIQCYLSPNYVRAITYGQDEQGVPYLTLTDNLGEVSTFTDRRTIRALLDEFELVQS